MEKGGKRWGRWLAALGIIAFGSCLLLAALGQKGRVKQFTAFFAMPGEPVPEDNRMVRRIAEQTGVQVNVEWMNEQTSTERIESMIRIGEYPDFINGSDASDRLVAAGALVPLEGYLEKYPNLEGYLSREQWESLRKEDGHIYFIPPFGVVQGHDTATIPAGEAFWIQKRVLEWAGFPRLKTLDEYFDLIVSYQKEHPETGGKKNIGFEILCDGWRYYCLENPPMFLAGYPNDGCAIVDPVTQEASVYDTIPEARQYYQKLCEMYHQGVVDPETFTLSYNQYIERISEGNVLGFVDQFWNVMSAQNSLYARGMEDRTYVPFGITAEAGIEGNYNCTEYQVNTGAGIGISVDCKDVEGALGFIDQLLSPELMVLRHWGEKGIDYEVGEDGVFYRTKEQREIRKDGEYLKENIYGYPYFPAYTGMLADGINTVNPGEQPGEYYAQLSEYDKALLDAYGYQNWKEFLGPEKIGAAWYPLYSCKEDWPGDSPHGEALAKMEQVKRLWLPQVIMSPKEEFAQAWEAYMQEYQKQVDVEAYEGELNREIQRRIQAAGGAGE